MDNYDEDFKNVLWKKSNQDAIYLKIQQNRNIVKYYNVKKKKRGNEIYL